MQEYIDPKHPTELPRTTHWFEDPFRRASDDQPRLSLVLRFQGGECSECRENAMNRATERRRSALQNPGPWDEITLDGHFQLRPVLGCRHAFITSIVDDE